MYTGIELSTTKQVERAEEVTGVTTNYHFYIDNFYGPKYGILFGLSSDAATDEILNWVKTGCGINPFKPDKGLPTVKTCPHYYTTLNSQVEGEPRWQLMRSDTTTQTRTQIYTHNNKDFLDFVAIQLNSKARAHFTEVG